MELSNKLKNYIKNGNYIFSKKCLSYDEINNLDSCDILGLWVFEGIRVEFFPLFYEINKDIVKEIYEWADFIFYKQFKNTSEIRFNIDNKIIGVFPLSYFIDEKGVFIVNFSADYIDFRSKEF